MSINNVCVFISGLGIGGAEKQSILLAKATNEKYKTTLIVYRGKSADKKNLAILRTNNIEYYFLKGSGLARMIKLFKILKRGKFDIIFTYLPGDNFLGSIIGKLVGIKFIIGGIRSSNIHLLKFPVLLLLHHLFQDLTIFNNEFGKRIYQKKGFLKKKSIVIENCQIDITNQKSFREIDSSNIQILMVGRFVFQKDYETAIKAISYLYHDLNTKNIVLHICGYGKLEKDIREWLNKYKLYQITKLHIKPDNLPEIYSFSDIYFSSSEIEGFSNTIMEAMQYELPIVATNVGDNNKLVKNEENGFLVEKRNYKELALNLNKLVKSKSLRLNFGKASKELLIKNYSFDAFRKKYFNLIDGLKVK